MKAPARWKRFGRPILALAAFAVVIALSPLFGLAASAQPTPDITPEEARAAALEAYPGATVDEVELEDDEEEYDGRLVYEVELTLADGQEVEVIVDAETGDVIATEREEDDDDDRDDDDDDDDGDDDGR